MGTSVVLVSDFLESLRPLWRVDLLFCFGFTTLSVSLLTPMLFDPCLVGSSLLAGAITNSRERTVCVPASPGQKDGRGRGGGICQRLWNHCGPHGLDKGPPGRELSGRWK